MYRRALFHLTHEWNLRSIVSSGALRSDSSVRPGGPAVDLADDGAMERRRDLRVMVGPGGSPADYVPFHFAARSPLLHLVIEKNARWRHHGGPDSIIYLVTSIDGVIATGRPWIFSDGSSASAETKFSAEPAELDHLVAWQLLDDPYWHQRITDSERMRRTMAEFLVHDHLPLGAFCEVAANNHASAARAKSLLEEGGYEIPASVRPDWYH